MIFGNAAGGAGGGSDGVFLISGKEIGLENGVVIGVVLSLNDDQKKELKYFLK